MSDRRSDRIWRCDDGGHHYVSLMAFDIGSEDQHVFLSLSLYEFAGGLWDPHQDGGGHPAVREVLRGRGAAGGAGCQGVSGGTGAAAEDGGGDLSSLWIIEHTDSECADIIGVRSDAKLAMADVNAAFGTEDCQWEPLSISPGWRLRLSTMHGVDVSPVELNGALHGVEGILQQVAIDREWDKRRGYDSLAG